MSHSQPSNKTFFGHPVQLATLFHIELWERFTTKGGLGIDKALAGGIWGAYGGSVNLSTIFGAWLADRVWGAEKTLFVSGVVVMLGHIALATLPGLTGLFIWLPLIALSSGGVKPTVSTMVGSLYESEERRPLRDAGFSFLCFVPFVASGKPMSMLVFALLLIIFVVGELLLSLIATSFATKIAPPVFKTQMVALNFLAFSIGFTLGGLLFKNFYDAKQTADFYQLWFYIGIVAGGLMLVCAPVLNKVLKDVD